MKKGLTKMVATLMFAGSLLTAGVVLGTPVLADTTPVPTSQTNNSSGNPFTSNLEGSVKNSLPKTYASQSFSNDPRLIVMRLIRIALSFVGIGLVGLLVYAGYMWMTAAGDDSKVDTAKSTIKNAVIGLIIILMAYTISTYIIQRIQMTTRAYGSGGSVDYTGIQSGGDTNFSQAGTDISNSAGGFFNAINPFSSN